MMEGSVALARWFVLPTSLADLWSAPRLRGPLSGRDVMKVARQFIAWNCPQKGPSRRVQYDCWDRRLTWSAAMSEIAALYQIERYGTDPFRECVPGNELPGCLHHVPMRPVELCRKAATDNCPGLKPWAILYSRFAASPTSPTGQAVPRVDFSSILPK